jgi:hypothetical protein
VSRSTNARALGPHLPRLQRALARLQAIEGTDNIDWVALFELRERADPLTDDAYYRGYVVGMLDALGVSVAEALGVLRSRPRRRIIRANRTGTG